MYTQTTPEDRRSAIRFVIEEAVRYSPMGKTKLPAASGSGKVINISSTGVYFTTDAALIPRSRVELSMAWPQQLNGTVGLRFVARGRVVRSEVGRAAVEILQYEFRTAKA